ANACAFNVESILIEAVDDDGPLLVVGPLVDGIGSSYEARERGDVNFLVDAFKTVELPEDGTTAIGPIGVIGASESVVVLIFSDEIIDKIEFNGEQPQGMELELIVTEEND
ncbi:MAG: hypothetical protein ACRD5H_16920, partial [Nitrososphaerales archaeon]